MVEKNVGGMERNVRLVLGLALLIVGVVVVTSGIPQIISLLAGAILVGTGALQYCPINQGMGRNTFKA